MNKKEQEAYDKGYAAGRKAAIEDIKNTSTFRRGLRGLEMMKQMGLMKEEDGL